MSSDRIKSIQKHNFKVCRFCLNSDADELDSIYDKITDDVMALNTIIKNVLMILQIQIPSNDPLPKLICIGCRDSLISVHHFRRNAQKSMTLLLKAIETKSDSPVVDRYSDEEYTADRDKSPIECDRPLKSDAGEDNDEVIRIKEENDVATTAVSIGKLPEQIKEEDEYMEEDYLEDGGFIPIEDGGEIIVYNKPPKAPRTRKPPTAKICSVCGAKTTAMSVHMRTHTNDRPFACSLCDLKFYTNGKLRCHYDSVHVGERKFSCEICGKSFVLKKNLKAHIMSHSTKREHVCAQCSKSFLFKWSLTAHERIHTGERPYVCTKPDCGKRFVTVSNLIQHQKTTNHLKEAPEEMCPLCGKAFQTKASLKAHHTKTHGSEMYL